jgi:hypothetical protein
MNIAGVGTSDNWNNYSSGKSMDVSSEMSMLAMKQTQNSTKEQGQALVELVNQASNVITPHGRVDVYA